MAERAVDPTRQGALAGEVERLRAGLFAQNNRAFLLDVELAEIKAALPLLIGCAAGKGLACTLDAHGWHSCCLALRKARELGLAPPVERRDEQDGA